MMLCYFSNKLIQRELVHRYELRNLISRRVILL